jgi:hypothetical protein
MGKTNERIALNDSFFMIAAYRCIWGLFRENKLFRTGFQILAGRVVDGGWTPLPGMRTNCLISWSLSRSLAVVRRGNMLLTCEN